MLRLYDYPSSGQCFKVRTLLRLLGRDYERIPVDIFAGETLTDEYERINPARRVPTLEVAPGAYLAESAAILLYLAEGTPYLPDDAFQRAQAFRWMIFEQTDFRHVPAARFMKVTGRDELEPDEFAARIDGARDALAFLDRHRPDTPFLVGEQLTIADLALFGYGQEAHRTGIDMTAYPRVQEWLDRVAAVDGIVNDIAPYPENALPGRGTSVYG